jgi:glycerol kinase
MVFDRKGAAVAVAQKEHRQIYPQPGWVEHDPAEIVARTREVVAEAMERGGLVAGCFARLADLRGNWPAVPLAGWPIRVVDSEKSWRRLDRLGHEFGVGCLP